MIHKNSHIVFVCLVAVLTSSFFVPGSNAQSEAQEDTLEDLRSLKDQDLPEDDDEDLEDAAESDFGIARLLRRPEEFKHYRITAGAFAGHNSNVPLDPVNEQDDWFHTENAKLSYRPDLRNKLPNTQASISVSLQRMVYDDFDNNFSFSSFLAEASASHVLNDARTRSLYGRLSFQDIFDGRDPSEGSTQRKGIARLGFRQTYPVTRFHQFIVDVAGSVEESFRVAGSANPGDVVDSQKNTLEASLSYFHPFSRQVNVFVSTRAQRRFYLHQGADPLIFNTSKKREDDRFSGSAGVDYKITDAFKARLNGSLTSNDSNQQNLLGQERDYEQWRIMAGIQYNTNFHEF